MWGLPPLRWMFYPAVTQPRCCGCGGKHTANYRGFVKWKEAKVALAKQAPERSRKSVAAGQPAAPKAQRASPSAEQMNLGEGWNHVVQGRRVVNATTTSPTNPHPNPPPQQVTEAAEQPIVTATRETAKPQIPEPKSTASPKRTAGKSKKKTAANVKTDGRQTHTTKPGGPHPKFHLPNRGNLRSPRSPSPPSICGPNSTGPHVYLLPPHRGSSPAGCPENHHPFRGRIWQHSLGGWNGVKPYASSAGMRTECAARRLNWSIFSASRVSIFVS